MDQHSLEQPVSPSFTVSPAMAKRYPNIHFDEDAYVAWLRERYPFLTDDHIRDLDIQVRKPGLRETILDRSGEFSIPQSGRRTISIFRVGHLNRTLGHESEHFADSWREPEDQARQYSRFCAGLMIGSIACMAAGVVMWGTGMATHNLPLMDNAINVWGIGVGGMITAMPLGYLMAPNEIAARKTGNEFPEVIRLTDSFLGDMAAPSDQDG